MARFFIGFLMIFLINKQASSFDIFGINLANIRNVYYYIDQFHQKTGELRQYFTLHGQNEAVALHDLMRELGGLSTELVNIQNNEDARFNTILGVLSDKFDESGDLWSTESELLHHINHFENFYNQSMIYDLRGSISPEIFKVFSESVLSSTSNLLETVYNIHTLIFPGPNSFLRSSLQTLLLTYVEAHHEELCDRGISEQQRIFYIFMKIIHTHLKAFATVAQAYSIHFAFDQAEYPLEYRSLMLQFHTQLTEYLEESVEIMRFLPKDIHRCDTTQPYERTEYLEFEGLFQVIVATEFDLRRKFHISYPWFGWSQGSCEDIRSTRLEQLVVFDCATIDSIRGCPVTRSRQARYSWWKTASATYGHPYDCPNSLVDVVNEQDAFTYNDVCTCSVGFTPGPLYLFPPGRNPLELENPKIRWFSIEPQMSDVANNMVVVGVRFIVQNNAIHLQIKQGKLWNDVNQTHGVWKPVDRDNNNKTIPIRYGGLHYRRNIMYLDDVGVDPRYVVTGVRLQLNKNGDGYELNVHGTEYIHETNVLGRSQMWYKPGDYPTNPMDYQRNRTEIHLNDPDDPTAIIDYHPDLGTNKFVQFQHSSVRKDGGYHTVPFFDAQPVEVTMHSPLGGIGLFYRGRDGFGGYIAPRLFTFNFTEILGTFISKWVEFDHVYRQCYDDKLNITVSQKSADCAKLRMNIQKIRTNVGSSFMPESQNMPLNLSTTTLTGNSDSDDSAGFILGHTVSDHVAATKRLSTTGDTPTIEDSPRVTTDLSSNITTSQSTGNHSTTKLQLSSGDSFTAIELPRESRDMSDMKVISCDAAINSSKLQDRKNSRINEK